MPPAYNEHINKNKISKGVTLMLQFNMTNNFKTMMTREEEKVKATITSIEETLEDMGCMSLLLDDVIQELKQYGELEYSYNSKILDNNTIILVMTDIYENEWRFTLNVINDFTRLLQNTAEGKEFFILTSEIEKFLNIDITKDIYVSKCKTLACTKNFSCFVYDTNRIYAEVEVANVDIL